MSKGRLKVADMAREAGVSVITVRRWVDLGCPHERDGKGKTAALTFDKAAVLGWMEKSGHTGAVGRPPAGAERVAAPDPAAGDLVKLSKANRALQVQLKQVELARAKRLERIADGELHDRGACERGRLARIAVVRAGLLSLPGKLSARLAQRDAVEIQAVIEREVHALLSQFSGQAVQSLAPSAGAEEAAD